VFPVAALVVVLLSFLDAPVTAPIVGASALALAPWAVVAVGIRVPSSVVILGSVLPVAWLVIHYGDQPALFLPIVAIAWAAAGGELVATILGVAGGSATAIMCSMARHAEDGGHQVWAIWTTGMLFGWFAGAMLQRERNLTAQLASARRELDLAAVAEERKGIAREVHDIVGHGLTVALLNISGARRHLATNPAAAAEALERAEQVSRESLESIRTVVGLLSSGADRQGDAPLPSGADVVVVVDQASRSGLAVRLDLVGDPSELDTATGLTLVRLLQEALANASRHAPGAPIDVAVALDDRAVSLCVGNDLTAHTPPSGRRGLGVAGMHDRVAALHGRSAIGAEGGRWVVRCTLPRSLRHELGTQPTAVAPDVARGSVARGSVPTDPARVGI
jgi:signal transduction histidine kinase